MLVWRCPAPLLFFLSEVVYADAHMNALNDTSSGNYNWVSTISFKSNQLLCLDLNNGDTTNGNSVLIWECNGHQSQEWYFVGGTYRIASAVDKNKCIDAGDMQQGTGMQIWDCNGQKQQNFGYDSNLQTVYLSASHQDASMCLDLPGGKQFNGNPAEVWGCSGGSTQQWVIQPGISIRVSQNYHLCLDLAGGKTDNGTPIQTWQCNGLQSQMWTFWGGDYRVRYAADLSKCIDAGNSAEGNKLTLWDCNSQPQQQWGYDPKSGTIYLSSSESDASKCMDLYGGSMQPGTAIQVWGCNGCWNQKFLLNGPAQFASLDMQDGLIQPSSSSCPPLAPPGPGPSPGPSGTFYPPHCGSGGAGNWPSFQDHNSLASSKWAAYFKKVYGGIPTTGYPICIANFDFIYEPIATAAGVVSKAKRECPQKNSGDYYKQMGPAHLEASWNSWIYNPTHYVGMPKNHWIEITHRKQGAGLEGHGSWMYYAPGTAIWFNLGNTQAYNDHVPAMVAIIGSSKGCSPTSDCTGHLNELMQAAAKKGIQSLQFLHRHHYLAPPCTRAIEVVGTFGSGTSTCGKGWLRAGWEASQPCNCDDKESDATCAGFGIKGNGDLPEGVSSRYVFDENSTARPDTIFT